MKHSVHMKHLASGLLGLVIAALVLPVSAQTKVTIGTARDPNLGAQIVIARDKGFFRQAGLDVAVKYFPSGGDLMSAFASGSIDYGSSGTTPVVGALSRGVPLKIIAQIADISGAQQLIVKKSIDSLDGLKGKKIGVLLGTDSQSLWAHIVKAHRFDAKSVTLVNMGPAEMIAAFVRGDVAGLSVWEPHATKARELGDGKALITGTYSYLGGVAKPQRIFGDHAVLFANEAALQNKAATQGVFSALQKADDFMMKHRREAAEVLGKEFGLKPADMEAIMGPRVNRYTLRVNGQLISDMNKLAAFLHSVKTITRRVNVRSAIDVGPLKAFDPGLVTLR